MHAAGPTLSYFLLYTILPIREREASEWPWLGVQDDLKTMAYMKKQLP